MTLHLPYIADIIFRHPERFFIAAFLLVILLLIWRDGRCRRKIMQIPWIKEHLVSAEIPGRPEKILWWFSAFLAVLCLIAALAAPEKAITEYEKVYGKIRITFLLDVSLSMKLAEDIKPNRLTAAKDAITDLINLLSNDPDLKGRYSLALIPFADAAQPFFASFTDSREEFLANLAEADEKTISKQGTSLLAVFNAYEKLLSTYPPEKNTTDLAFLISDGGREEGRTEEKTPVFSLIRRITKLPDHRVVVNTVGIGYYRPVELIVRDESGAFVDFYRKDPKDPKSQIQKSELDEKTLKEIASLGRGDYKHFTEHSKILEDFKSIVLKNREIIDSFPHTRYESIKNWFLIPAFAIFYFIFGYASWLI